MDELFSRFPRVVRDLADRSGKEIELRIIGQETRLDRTIVERLSDPMIHLIRNAVDHALEHPQERLDKGKPREGRITLSAGHEGDRVAVRVEDDGRGLDRETNRAERDRAGDGSHEHVARGSAGCQPDFRAGVLDAGHGERALGPGRGARRGPRRRAGAAGQRGGREHAWKRDGLHLPIAADPGLDRRSAGRDGRRKIRGSAGAGRGMRGPERDSDRPCREERPCVSVRGELVPTVSLRGLFRADGPLPARQELLLTRHAGQRVGVAVDRLLGRVQAVIQSLGRGLARPESLFGSHDPRRRLRFLDPGSIRRGFRVTICRTDGSYRALGQREGGECSMRIPLRVQITIVMVLFGLVPASLIVAWFAYRANDEFKDKQTLIVQQAAAYISDHFVSVVQRNARSR